MSIVHHTPGLLDIRAFTMMGFHAKPNTTSPIGKFGTGLKYAIATLLRSGCLVRLFIGKTEYEFYVRGVRFREKDFDQIMLRKRNGMLAKWQYIELPFTTEFGRYWKPWQAFRELHSNTLDENGVTFEMAGEYGPKGHLDTVIVVEGAEYDKAFHDMDAIFLPTSLLTPRYKAHGVECYNEPSKHLYWRGIRVFDLEEDKPSMYTWNITDDMVLTEDRTLAHMWSYTAKLAGFVARSTDEKIINSIVSLQDKDKHFENKLDFSWSGVVPGETFLSVMAKKTKRGAPLSSYSRSYYRTYDTEEEEEEETLDERIDFWATNENVPEGCRKLLVYLQSCTIEEPDK